MTNPWLFMSYLGVKEDMPVYRRKSTILFNQIIRMIGIIMLVASISFFFVLKFKIVAYTFWFCLFFIGITLILNYKGYVYGAVLLLSNLFPVIFLSASLYMLSHNQSYNIMLYMAPRIAIMIFTILPVAFIGFCDTKKALLGSIVGLICYFGFDYFHYLLGINVFSLPYVSKYYSHFLVALTVSYLVIIFLLLFLQKINNEYEKMVEAQKKEIEQQRDEIEAQMDEIEYQKDEIEAQRDLLSHQNKKVTDSIQYASRIQNAALPSSTEINETLPPNFILYKPKDIVSGDFYFVRQQEKQIMFAVADCTGHGVPGGFMSMLGIAFLNEIGSATIKLSSLEVLNKLREKIKNFLGQQNAENTQKDGMDIAFCIFDTQTRTLEFSGANNGFFLSRQGELLEFKGNKMPIGIHIKDDEPFTSQSIPILEGDLVYLFSDGYVDQFGGEKNEKFKVRRLRELLISISSYSLSQQKEELNAKIDAWRGNREQVDDITVLGIQF